MCLRWTLGALPSAAAAAAAAAASNQTSPKTYDYAEMSERYAQNELVRHGSRYEQLAEEEPVATRGERCGSRGGSLPRQRTPTLLV
eukprot:COSAG05_NODE_2504_length_2974_cov_11.045565_1_plen_85_part_10